MAKKGKKQAAARAAAARAKAEEPQPQGDARQGVKGLKNLGNTCYVNSVIQCMHAATPFRESLPCGNGNSICSSLSSVMRSMSGPGAAVGPKALHSAFCNKFPWFKGHQQHDAHEFFCTLVGAVADEKQKGEEDESGEEASKNFQGQLCSSVLCWKCKKISVRVCPFFHLSLPVPECDADCGPLGIPAHMQKAAEHPEPPMAPEEPEQLQARDPAEATVSGEPPEEPEPEAEAKEEPVKEATEEEAFETAEDQPVQPVEDEESPETAPEAEAAEVAQEEAEEESPAKQEQEGVEDAEAEEEAESDQPFTFEVLLRSRKTGRQDYGFKWNMSALSKDQLLVASVQPASILDKWNRKRCHAEPQKVVREGDQILRVGRESAHKQMQQALKSELEVALLIQRSDVNAPMEMRPDLMDDDESDEEEMDQGEPLPEVAPEVPEVKAEAPEAATDKAAEEEVRDEAQEAREEAQEEAQDSEAQEEAEESQAKQEDEGKDADEAEEEAESDQPFTFEVLLRSEKASGRQDYGFKWNMSALSKDQLLVASVWPESILDNWNLKQHTLGEPQKVVRPGDQILRVCQESRHKQMQQALKKEPEVTLLIQRSDVNAPMEIRHDLMKDDREDQEEMEDRKERQTNFQRAWKSCRDELCEDLASMYQGHRLGINGESCRLMDCLQKFAGVEAMEEDFHPSYDCSDCAKDSADNGNKKPKTFATSKAHLCGEMPQLLTVQLKRFNRKLQKIKTRVEIPATLDLKELALTCDVAKTMREHLKAECEKQELPIVSKDENTKYELFGIVQHHGSTLQGGHYTAYVNLGPSLEEPLWYFCNDAVVSKCTLQDALKAETYVAFYRKVGEED